ncbi:MAG TPA: HDOD domain-containing protein [Rhodoferax sp.]|nr:HDOD domain-containing protein [Rhodoferax sp.]
MDCKTINYKNIPVQSEVIAGIIRLDVDSASCFRELENLVGSDQGVTTLLLRVVNSSLYSRGRNITTIPLAISVLGFNVVRSLALLALTRSLFSQTKNLLFRTHVWQHSLLTALASQSICGKLVSSSGRDESFVAGLMHDTGKVLLFNHDQNLCLEAISLSIKTGCSSLEAEQHFFGVTHVQIGREAVTQWRLPERFNDYMAFDLSVPRAQYATDVVLLSLAVANTLIKWRGIGGCLTEDTDVQKSTLMALGLNEPLCDSLLDETFVSDLMKVDTYKLFATI